MCMCVTVRLHLCVQLELLTEGRETANFSSGERREGAEEGFDEQDRCCGAEILIQKTQQAPSEAG